jgi:glycosyltransferase involved in cell wall biosynthesis
MAARAVQDDADVLLLYVGPDGEAFQDAMQGLPVLNSGPLPAGEVSRRFHAMDMYLAPFIDGASTRRGSFLVGLQHGVPTVSTHGPLTDSLLLDHDRDAFILAPAEDPKSFRRSAVALCRKSARRRKIGMNARRFYSEHFRWEVLADGLLDGLSSHERASVTV